MLGYGWIKRGEDREVPSNTGRRRLNINGAVDLKRLEPVVRYDDTIDTASTIALFDQILLAVSFRQGCMNCERCPGNVGAPRTG